MTVLADELSQALFDYQQYMDMNRNIGWNSGELFKKAQKALYWIYNAHAIKAVEPGPSLYAKMDQLVKENEKLRNQVNELTKKIGEKDFIIDHLGGKLEGDVNKP